MNKKELIIIIFALLIILLLGYYFITKSKIGPVGSTHEHADFKVYINGGALNFAHPEYMVRAKEVHIEDMIGTVIHKHATGITLGYFFKSLGFKFNEKCFILDDEREYCNKENENKILKFYVNGERNYEYDKYEIKDDEKYLISYGNEDDGEIQEQLGSI